MVNSSGQPNKSPTPPGVRAANPVPPARKNHQMMNGGVKKGQTMNTKAQNTNQRPQAKVSLSRSPSSPAAQNGEQVQDDSVNAKPKPIQQTQATVPVTETPLQQTGSQNQHKPDQLQSKPVNQTHSKPVAVQPQVQSSQLQPQLSPSQVQPQGPQEQKPNSPVQPPPQPQMHQRRQSPKPQVSEMKQQEKQIVHLQNRSHSQHRPEQDQTSQTLQQLQPQPQPHQQRTPLPQPQSHQQRTPQPQPQPHQQPTLQPQPHQQPTPQPKPQPHQQPLSQPQPQPHQPTPQPIQGKSEIQSPQQPTQGHMSEERQQVQKFSHPQQIQQCQQSFLSQPSQQPLQSLQTQQSQELQNEHSITRPNPTNEANASIPPVTHTQQSPLQSPEILLQPLDAQQQILLRQRQLRPVPKPSINGVVLDQPVQANKEESNLNPFFKQQMVKSPSSGRRVVLVRKVKKHPSQSCSEENCSQSIPVASAMPVGVMPGAGGLRKQSFGGFQPRDQAKQILGQHINRRLSQTQAPSGASQPNLTISQGDLSEPLSAGEHSNNLVTMADFSVSTPENLASVKEVFPTTLANTQPTQRQQTTSQLSLPSQTRLVSASTPTLQASLTSPTSITSQALAPRRLQPKCENLKSSLDHVPLPAEAITEVANSAAIGQENPAEVRRSSRDEIGSITEGSILECGAVRSQVFTPQYRKNKSIVQLAATSGQSQDALVTNTTSNVREDGKPIGEFSSAGKAVPNASPVVEREGKNEIPSSTKEPLAAETAARNRALPVSRAGGDKRIDPTEEVISQPQKAGAVPSLSQEKRNEDITVDKTKGELPLVSVAASDKNASDAGKEAKDRDEGVSVKQKRFNEMKSYKIGEKCRLQVEARTEMPQKDQSTIPVDQQPPAAPAGQPCLQEAITKDASLTNDSCLDRNNNDNVEEMFRKMYGKELASLQAKYEAQVEALTASLARKEEELVRTRSEASEALSKSLEEQRVMRVSLTKEREELEDKHKKEREVREREEKERREREEKERRDREEERREREEKERREKEEKERQVAEERRKKEEKEKDDKIQNDENSKNKSSESEGADEEEEETEEESNKRKIEKMQMEMLLLKQQNEEFEEMVREKYRRQVELELQIGEISNEVAQKEGEIQSVRVELSYAKNATAQTRARVTQLEEEVAEHKLKVEALEQELDTAERELKRMEILQEKLRVTEGKRNELQAQIDEIEVERDEEIKIIQDALDEAAQEREELLTTFEKEIEKLNSLNTAREAQMLQEFEDKLKELEQQHKSKLEEKEREAKSALHRSKRLADEEDVRQRLERLRSDLTSEWEDKLRSECARLKGELDSLHSEEKHLAVESIKVQKEQELQEVRKGVDCKVEALNKEIAELKRSLGAKDEFYQQEIDEIRTRADRDVWELRRKLQKLDESSYDRQQHLEDKHREDLERLREEYADKMAGLEAQLSCVDVRGLTDLRTKLEAVHKQQMEHLGEQHRLSMERLRDELEAEKVQAAEEARVIVSKHHEYINESLKEQLAEAVTSNTQYREEVEAIKFALGRREEVIRSLEEDVAKLRASKGSSPTTGSPPSTAGSPAPTAGSAASYSSFQFPHEGSQGSRSSQDRLSNDTDEDGHKGSGLLGKVFGGGWFSATRARDASTPGYSSPSGGSSKKNRQST